MFGPIGTPTANSHTLKCKNWFCTIGSHGLQLCATKPFVYHPLSSVRMSVLITLDSYLFSQSSECQRRAEEGLSVFSEEAWNVLTQDWYV